MVISRVREFGARAVERLAQLIKPTTDRFKNAQDRARPGGVSEDHLDDLGCRVQPLGDWTDHRLGQSCDIVSQLPGDSTALTEVVALAVVR
ncbi:hypothetical protein Aglo02_23470 [Actinokineospora globicatena]|nr:hypothetical protein Aglo02_23470 [Actinokineospora globicatena]